MPDGRVLITVKTYPTLSRKYGETVCTAGVREDGSWVRIYPVPFRRLDEQQQYAKYDWIDCKLVKSKSDPRPETRHPADLSNLTPVGRMNTEDGWRDRRRLLLRTAEVYTQLQPLIEAAKANTASLAVFKPAKIIDFVVEKEDRNWDAAKVAEMRAKTAQTELFAEESWRETFKIIPKLPYSFSYQFADADGRQSTMQILDWEIGALYWNCLRRCDGHEAAALDKVRTKYFQEFLKTDLHFNAASADHVMLHLREDGAPWTLGGFRTAWQREMTFVASNARDLHPAAARAKEAAFSKMRENRIVFHGLRKNAVIALLEVGCTEAEAGAIVGMSEAMVRHYAKEVSTRRLATNAMKKLEAGWADIRRNIFGKAATS